MLRQGVPTPCLLQCHRLKIDGIAGKKTIAALIDFQKKHGLVADGICGPLTREKLKGG